MLKNSVRNRLIVILALVALGPPAASGQEPAERGPRLLGGLAADFDTDGDGSLSREEFDRGVGALFAELDRDGDGRLDAEELPRFRSGMGRHRRPGLGFGPMAGMIVARAADGDGDGEVASREWRAFLDSLTVEDDGTVSEQSLHAALPIRRRAAGEATPPGLKSGHGPPPGRLSRVLDRDGDAVLEIDDLNAVFAELDQDGDGDLKAEELPRLPGHRGPPGR